MPGRYRAFDEEKALAAAAEVFWIKGYTAASLEDLLEAMQLNKGSMYNAFGNKRALFIQVFHWFSRRFLLRMQTVFDLHDNPLDAIRKIFTDVARASDPALHEKGCFYVNILGEMSGMDKELGDIAASKLREVESLFCTQLKKARKLGLLHSRLSPDHLARYLVNCWNGINISRRMYSGAALDNLVKLNLSILE